MKGCQTLTVNLKFILSYWPSWFQLFTGRRSILATIDIPLVEAPRRTKLFTIWTLFIIAIAVAIVNPVWWQTLLRTVLGHSSFVFGQTVLSIILWIITWIVASFVGYGFLRLYTLISHVMTTNIFKTRGQRLRLLNAYTTLLPFLSVASIVSVITTRWPFGGYLFGIMMVLYAAYLVGIAFQTIFHKSSWLSGFSLFLAATLVTLFIVTIGAIAFTAVLAVLIFFALVIARAFHR